MKNLIILASASPRRAEILSRLALDFIVHASPKAEPLITDIDELENLAKFKAEAVHEELLRTGKINSEGVRNSNNIYNKDWLILAADTIVHLDNNIILGKPKDSKEAVEMLSRLSGRKHQVSSAICLMGANGRLKCSREETIIYFRKLSQEEIINYVREFQPFDKAGAYAIQEAASLFIARIEGCYSNVVGLPVGLLLNELEHV